jgi:tetratricopeptide (TPR) repeat protein
MDMQEAFDRGDFLGIIEAADSAVNPEDKLLVGISMFKLGRLSDAMKVFNGISDLMSELAKAFYYMALIHKERGNMESARYCMSQYTPFYPDDEEALEIIEADRAEPELLSVPSLELAKIYAAQGHFEQALEIYLHLLKDNDGDQEMNKRSPPHPDHAHREDPGRLAGKDEEMKVMLINGPNLNLLGSREKSLYGSMTLSDLESLALKKAESLGMELVAFQSNHEGEIIDRIHSARGMEVDAILINPGHIHTRPWPSATPSWL